MQAWAEGPDVESRISLAPIAVQLTLAGPGARGAYIALAQLRRGGLPFKMNGSPPRVCLSTGQYCAPRTRPSRPTHVNCSYTGSRCATALTSPSDTE